MARIKIEYLPVNEEMGEQELKGVFGGYQTGGSAGLRSLKSFGSFGNSRGAIIAVESRGNSRGAVIPVSSRSVDKEIVNTSLIR